MVFPSIFTLAIYFFLAFVFVFVAGLLVVAFSWRPAALTRFATSSASAGGSGERSATVKPGQKIGFPVGPTRRLMEIPRLVDFPALTSKLIVSWDSGHKASADLAETLTGTMSVSTVLTLTGGAGGAATAISVCAGDAVELARRPMFLVSRRTLSFPRRNVGGAGGAALLKRSSCEAATCSRRSLLTKG